MITKIINFLFNKFLLNRVEKVIENSFDKMLIRGKKENLKLGKNVRIGRRVEFECKNGTITIGDNCVIMSDVKILSYGGNITIGNDVSVNPFSILYGHGGLIIGNFVRIANNTVIIPSNHNYSDISKPIYLQGETSIGVKIGNDVWLGSNVKILDDVIISDGIIVGAGSLVSKSLLDKYGIYLGTPAKFIKYRND